MILNTNTAFLARIANLQTYKLEHSQFAYSQLTHSQLAHPQIAHPQLEPPRGALFSTSINGPTGTYCLIPKTS